MSLDAYSPCPGGIGKKIKFCCPDFVGELEKIDRMVEGEQYQACLDYVRRLLEKSPERACLMATECLLARLTDQLEAAESAVARFAVAHPGNPLAWSENAIITAVNEGGTAAMPSLQRALELSGRELSGRVYETLWTVGQVLALDEEFLAAEAVLAIQTTANPQDPRPFELLARIYASPTIPLWAREPLRLKDCPADVPWKKEWEEAFSRFAAGVWSEAADRLAALAARVGDVPALWYNVATLRAWSADRPRAIEALRKYASLDVPLEDAVEAEALALYLSDDPLEDSFDVFSLEYAVDDVEQLQAALDSARHLDRAPDANFAKREDEDSPPPKAVYLVGDREKPAVAEGLLLESVSRTLGIAALYGRETDRPGRLEVAGVTARDLQPLKSALALAAGRLLGPPCKEEAVDRTSATRTLFATNWLLPRETGLRQFDELAAENQRDALMNRWPQLPLGILGGKRPQEAAGDPAQRTRLLAAILLVESWREPTRRPFDFNQLRARLGLPTLEPIDPDGMNIAALPAARLARVVVEKLSDEALLACYRRALGLNAAAALRKLAQGVIDRPGVGDRAERTRAFATLARLQESSDQALACLDRGRKETEAAGESCAAWDLLELTFRFERLEAAEVNRLLRHVESRHLREPGVATAVQNLLVRFGAIRPDGTPVAAAAPQPQEEPAVAVPGGAADDPGKLWLPEGQQPAGEKPRIWTPGMD